MPKSKVRPMGTILLDLEEVLQTYCYKHDFLWGTVLLLTRLRLEMNCPNAQEQYTSGGNPRYYYGSPAGVKAYKTYPRSKGKTPQKILNHKQTKTPKKVSEKTSETFKQLLIELCEVHDLQWGDVFNLIKGYLEIHIPEAQERYSGGASPIFYYGPAEGLLKK
jgi:hypothetical protein